MRPSFRVLTLAARLLLGASVPLAGAAALGVPVVAHAGPVEETRPAKADGSVQIISVSTDIEVVGTDAAQVHVEGEIADGASLEIVSKASSTRIVVEPPRKGRGGDEVRTALVIHIPRRSNVMAKAVSGRLRMSAVEGGATLESVSGSITVDGKPKELQAISVSGSLYLVSTSERTRAKTVSGKVHISGSRGQLEASSVSGAVEVEKTRLSRCELATVSGSIAFDGALLPDGPHEFKSHAGRIRLTLPRDEPVEIEASSFSGTIRNKLDNDDRRGKAEIVVGKGGPVVKVRTFSGGILVEPK